MDLSICRERGEAKGERGEGAKPLRGGEERGERREGRGGEAPKATGVRREGGEKQG